MPEPTPEPTSEPIKPEGGGQPRETEQPVASGGPDRGGHVSGRGQQPESGEHNAEEDPFDYEGIPEDTREKIKARGIEDAVKGLFEIAKAHSQGQPLTAEEQAKVEEYQTTMAEHQDLIAEINGNTHEMADAEPQLKRSGSHR
jgi:hypothetical protein